MASSKDTEQRTAFEAWTRTNHWKLVPLTKRGGSYIHPGIESDWIVWQAAAGSAQSSGNSGELQPLEKLEQLATPRAAADVELEQAQLIEDLSKWTGVGGMIKADMFVGRAKAIIDATKP